MFALDVIKDAVENQLAVKLTYHDETRLVSPTAIQHISSTGNTVLVGLEPCKGWRKYITSEVGHVELTQVPHQDVAEIDMNSFTQEVSNG